MIIQPSIRKVKKFIKTSNIQYIGEFNLSLEEEILNTTAQELEYVFYAKITDPDVLKLADETQIQEQWEIKLPQGSARIRVRFTKDSQQEQYTLTIKTPNGENSVNETTIEVSADVFSQIKSVASSGMNKIRYIYHIPKTDLKWEVDVPIMPEGQQCPWCKIDLEVPNPLEDHQIPKLPNGFSVIIKNQKQNMTDKEKELLQSLYNDYFLTDLTKTKWKTEVDSLFKKV